MISARKGSPPQVRAEPRLSRGVQGYALAGCGALFAAGAGILVVFEPLVITGIAAVPCAVLLFTRAPFRVAYVVIGALVVLQGQSEAAKTAYLIGLLVAIAGAMRSAQLTSHMTSVTRPLRYSGIAILVIAPISFLVAAQHGVQAADWFRTIAAYLLFAAVPIFANDFSAIVGRGRRVLIPIFAAGGVLTSLAFAIQWAQYHGLATFSVQRILWPSYFLAGAFICYASARAMGARKSRVGWVLMSVLTLTLMLVNGTRVSLLLFLPVVGLAIASPGPPSLRFARCASIPALIAVVILCVFVASAAVDISVSNLTTRFASVATVLSSPQTDLSYSSRAASTDLAITRFEQNPLLGVGPGYAYFLNNTASLDYRYTLGLDSPVFQLSEFGMMGVGLYVIIIWALVMTSRRVLRLAPRSVPSLALVAYLVMAGVELVTLGTPIEDKGFSVGLIFLLALALVDGQKQSQRQTSVTTS